MRLSNLHSGPVSLPPYQFLRKKCFRDINTNNMILLQHFFHLFVKRQGPLKHTTTKDTFVFDLLQSRYWAEGWTWFVLCAAVYVLALFC